VPVSLALHSPLHVLVDDVGVDLSGGYPGVAQGLLDHAEVEV